MNHFWGNPFFWSWYLEHKCFTTKLFPSWSLNPKTAGKKQMEQEQSFISSAETGILTSLPGLCTRCRSFPQVSRTFYDSEEGQKLKEMIGTGLKRRQTHTPRYTTQSLKNYLPYKVKTNQQHKKRWPVTDYITVLTVGRCILVIKPACVNWHK